MNAAQKAMEKFSAQMQAGQFAAAAKTATAAAKKFPKEAGFANAAGAAHARAENYALAVTFFNKALSLAPGDPATQDNLLRALISAGRAEKALEQIAKLEPKRANKVGLWVLKANALMQRGDAAGVIETATQILEVAPDHPEALSLRGTAHDTLKQDDEAIADFQRFFDLTGDPAGLVNLADPLTRRHRPEDALAALEQAVSMTPDDARAQRFLAIQLKQMGRIAESNEAYRRLIALNPQDTGSYRALVSSQSADENAALKPTLEALLTKLPRKDTEGHAYLNLALGNICLQTGDQDAAATYLARGNALFAKASPYQKSAADAEFSAITATFTPDHQPDPAAGDKAQPRPFFIIGQPRSGTTLSEMILSAHPDVASCGEMISASAVLQKDVIDAGGNAAKLATAYRKELPPDARDAAMFVDKMPQNYRFVGYLLDAFPEARFLHLTRDPRDVALSMWREHFAADWMNFTLDLKAMAYQANLYKRYMQHWTTLYPDRILTLDYSDVVADVAGCSRRIAEFANLDWVPEMAAPEKNTAIVRSASLSQVRQKVHSKSVGGWRRLEKALAPFCEGLDPTLWPEIDL
ncbi:sulfotransferase [Shimia sp. SDUM112013]|uniref:tetratricopeptide repeat-containing sulfotransferase family protein n=1 Tax=Shimia sp. SDUM112013 TaxID=3136160 RepID=UPI0032EFBEF2